MVDRREKNVNWEHIKYIKRIYAKSLTCTKCFSQQRGWKQTWSQMYCGIQLEIVNWQVFQIHRQPVERVYHWGPLKINHKLEFAMPQRLKKRCWLKTQRRVPEIFRVSLHNYIFHYRGSMIPQCSWMPVMRIENCISSERQTFSSWLHWSRFPRIQSSPWTSYQLWTRNLHPGQCGPLWGFSCVSLLVPRVRLHLHFLRLRFHQHQGGFCFPRQIVATIFNE